MNNKIIKNILFPLPPSSNYNNIYIDRDCMMFITTPHYTKIITDIIRNNIPPNISYDDITIFDGTACVGGDTIAFGNIFGSVISVEIDKNRFYMLTKNINEYNLYNVIPINDNCLNILKKINFIDIVYLDPPWGGKNYKVTKSIRLSLSGIYIDDIVNDIINNIRSQVRLIVIKLPKNYDIKQLYKLTRHNNIQILKYILKKMIIIVYKLK